MKPIRYSIQYKTKRYELLWVGTTRRGTKRALIRFLTGKKNKFWINAELVSDIQPIIELDTVSN